MKSQSVFLLSKSKLNEQYNKITPLADQISFSLKTNPEVAKVLEKQTKCNFSVHSYQLLKQISNKDRVLFFAQAWDFDELDELQLEGINKFVVDNKADLDILLEYIKENEMPIQLLLRMRLKENTVHTGKHFVFGMKADEVNELIPILKNNPLIKKIGVHFHRKSQNISEWSLKDEMKEALEESTLQKIDILNIGGGLPITYKNSHPTLEPIFDEIKKLKSWLSNYNIQLVLEPGRFLSGPPIKLQTTIKNIYKDNIIIDASIYNTAVDTFASHVRLELESEDDSGTPFTIKGSTPCSLDIFRYRVYLNDPKPGDKITFKNAGAYNFKTDFCGLEKVNTIVVD